MLELQCFVNIFMKQKWEISLECHLSVWELLEVVCNISPGRERIKVLKLAV